jgi:hypothetical protein
MDKLLEISTNVATPLALSGLLAALFFWVVKMILENKSLFPQLTQQAGSQILKRVIDKLFILALVAMVLGFFGYVLNIVASGKTAPPPIRDVAQVTFPANVSLRGAIQTIAENEGHTASFTNCAEETLAKKVRPGRVSAKTTKDLIELLQFRIEGQPAPVTFEVIYLEDKGRYEIRCK